MTILGLTGPTGAGKSTVSARLAQAGLLVLDADRIGHELLLPGSPVPPLLAQAFGADILRPDGSVDRHALARQAFSSPQNTARLNALTHPQIEQRMLDIIAANAHYPATVIDAAVLIESGIYKRCDLLAVVLAPMQVRLERILRRDGISPDDARARMSAQHDDAFYLAHADFVLYNDPAHDLDAQIQQLLERVLP